MFPYTKIEMQEFEDFTQPFKIELRLIPEVSRSSVYITDLDKEKVLVKI